MSLTTNNQQLQTILDTVNALPDAGGSAAPETCTVTINRPKAGYTLYLQNWSRLIDGEVKTFYPSGAGIILFDSTESGTITIPDIIIGSALRLMVSTMIVGMWGLDSNVDVAYSTTTETVDNYEPSYFNGSTIGDESTMSPTWSKGIAFKILGDTTIKIWDDD